MERSQFRHFHTLPVRWGDMDALGHVNNANYFRYLESGRIAYLEAVVGTSVGDTDTFPVLVDIQCTFKTPLHYPATIEVGSRVVRLGNSSLMLEAAIFPQGATPPVATSRGVLVWCHRATDRPTPLPDPVRQGILAFEGGDLAGDPPL
ncbi:MAG: acyl-CoA thioesterase [Candidatus Competibacterales bacterium]